MHTNNSQQDTTTTTSSAPTGMTVAVLYSRARELFMRHSANLQKKKRI